MTGRMAIYDIRRGEFILIFLGGKRMMTGCIAITHTHAHGDTREYKSKQNTYVSGDGCWVSLVHLSLRSFLFAAYQSKLI